MFQHEININISLQIWGISDYMMLFSSKNNKLDLIKKCQQVHLTRKLRCRGKDNWLFWHALSWWCHAWVNNSVLKSNEIFKTHVMGCEISLFHLSIHHPKNIVKRHLRERGEIIGKVCHLNKAKQQSLLLYIVNNYEMLRFTWQERASGVRDSSRAEVSNQGPL